jgi:anti-sigma factor RsiW
MTDITHDEVRDALPDVVNGTIEGSRRRQIEDHLRSCTECASELRVVRMVKDAPSFAPMIDAVKVSSGIAPYGGVATPRPRTSTRMWQTLAAVAAVVVIAVTAVSRGHQASPIPAVKNRQVAAALPPAPTHATVTPSTDSPAKKAAAPSRPHELQVAVALDDISDGNLARLASELDGLDGLPSAEPENLGVADPGAESGGDQ